MDKYVYPLSTIRFNGIVGGSYWTPRNKLNVQTACVFHCHSGAYIAGILPSSTLSTAYAYWDSCDESRTNWNYDASVVSKLSVAYQICVTAMCMYKCCIMFIVKTIKCTFVVVCQNKYRLTALQFYEKLRVFHIWMPCLKYTEKNTQRYSTYFVAKENLKKTCLAL